MKNKFTLSIFIFILFLTTALNAEMSPNTDKEEHSNISKQNLLEINQLSDEQKAQRLNRFLFPALYVGIKDTVKNNSNDQLNEFICNVLMALGTGKVYKDY